MSAAPVCEHCFGENKVPKRIYEPEFWSSTCIGGSSQYWEDGQFHVHDLNSSVGVYSCSNGHSWRVTIKKACPTCYPTVCDGDDDDS